MDIKTKILEILSHGHLMSLATQDEGGLWVADLVYVYDEDLNIYWMSDPDVRHSKALIENSQVAGTITISNKSRELNLGIQFSGKAKKIDGARYDLTIKHLTKRGYPEPQESDDVLQGDSWYIVRPTKIDLIDEEHYGYDKKNLDL
ncbi:MAG: pyridoxamine 5'-phosphate oxidase family protein [Candidatus Daviesbacteria bacterium]|nr:pyridoxamine 5'-phosphate oxidase family protein [Candidatus Daviesbacteria bacterium]MDZ4205599.1 pyridoxamine 5'-phosphate oxidase family protein [Patescibacteria group bacterium]